MRKSSILDNRVRERDRFFRKAQSLVYSQPHPSLSRVKEICSVVLVNKGREVFVLLKKSLIEIDLKHHIEILGSISVLVAVKLLPEEAWIEFVAYELSMIISSHFEVVLTLDFREVVHVKVSWEPHEATAVDLVRSR